jgi:hypothetical protein
MTRHQGLEQRTRSLPPGAAPDTSGLGVSSGTVHVRARSDERELVNELVEGADERRRARLVMRGIDQSLMRSVS